MSKTRWRTKLLKLSIKHDWHIPAFILSFIHSTLQEYAEGVRKIMEQRLPDIQSYSLTKSVIDDYLKGGKNERTVFIYSIFTSYNTNLYINGHMDYY